MVSVNRSRCVRKHYRINCEQKDCPIYYEYAGRVPCIGTDAYHEEGEPIKILFVGSSPDEDETLRRLPLMNRGGILLRGLLRTHFHKMEGMAFCNVSRCRQEDDDKKIIQKAASICPFLKKDVLRLKPELIVLLGSTASEAILNKPLVSKVRGTVITHDFCGKPQKFFVTWNPTAAIKSPSILDGLIRDIGKALDIAEKKKLPDYSGDIEYKLLTTVSQVKAYVKHLLTKTKAKYIGFDIETKNLNKRYGNALLTLQFAESTKRGVVIPVSHPQSPFTAEEQKQVLYYLKFLFTKKPKFKYWVTHNGKFEQSQILNIITGKMITNVPMLDTMAGMFLLNENRLAAGGYGLAPLAREFLNYDYGKLKSMRSNLSDYDLELVAHYGAIDACKTLALFHVEADMAKSMDYYNDWMKLQVYLYGPAFGMFAHMENYGFYAHLPEVRLLKGTKSPILAKMRSIEHEILSLKSVNQANQILIDTTTKTKYNFGVPKIFNLKHKDHLLVLFKDVLGLEVGKTDKGNFSIGKNFYEKYKKDVHEVHLVSEHSELKKLATSYATQIYKFIDPNNGKEDCKEDSRVRPSFRFTGTVTGRTSSSSPNMQQIPRSTTPIRARIKNMFRAEQPKAVLAKWGAGKACTFEDNPTCLVQLDYMANEVRWWALFSKDVNLAVALNAGKSLRDKYRLNPSPELKLRAKIEGDMHRQTASRMFNIPIEKVTDDERQPAKTIVFGWMYGRSTKSIADQLASSQWNSEEESWDDFVIRVQGFCDEFAKAYPQAARWLTDIEKYAQKNGYSQSLIHRRRNLLSSYLSGDDRIIASANRQARNSPIQSNASDIAVVGVYLLQLYINKYNKPWLVQNAVHDSCVVQIPVQDVPDYLKISEYIFTDYAMSYFTKHWGINFTIPLEVDFEISQAPTHGWAALAKWDFSQPSIDAIIEGCLDPNKSLSKK